MAKRKEIVEEDNLLQRTSKREREARCRKDPFLGFV